MDQQQYEGIEGRLASAEARIAALERFAEVGNLQLQEARAEAAALRQALEAWQRYCDGSPYIGSRQLREQAMDLMRRALAGDAGASRLALEHALVAALRRAAAKPKRQAMPTVRYVLGQAKEAGLRAGDAC